MARHDDIRIGTLIHADGAAATIREIARHGFESFQITFGKRIGEIQLERFAKEICDALAACPCKAEISALGLYGNPLIDEGTAADWLSLIEAAEHFNCKIVAGFAGRLPDRPVPDSIPRFQEVFEPLAGAAEEHAVRIAFENCDMGGDWERGDWNIAHAPAAWEMMFEAVRSQSIGLEWEPCHQMVSFVDPLPQLHAWCHRIFHVHGKDATVMWDVVRTEGIRGGAPYLYHRTPGFGDTNWTDVISLLRMGGFRGAIDIEGWHDPVYRDELEMTGQVHAINYLKNCRGGAFVPNPA
jgi:sugar phosphate isomerase/epimerase